MPSWIYFFACAFIWGSTWHAINFQVGVGHPGYAVSFRFLLAALLLLVIIVIKRAPLRFSAKQHVVMAAAGLFLYTLDYTFLYMAQSHILGALLAVLSTSVIYFNVILRRVFLGKPMRPNVVIGASIGLVGISCIFLPELTTLQAKEGLLLGLLFALGSFLSASIGNMFSESILSRISVLSFNFYSMLYGSVIILSLLLVFDVSWQWPTQLSFYYALAYLSVFGSVMAFGCYMLLVQRMGSDKAAYVVLVYPIIALFIAQIFEGYQWTYTGMFGVGLIAIGNAIALKRTHAISPTKVIQ